MKVDGLKESDGEEAFSMIAMAIRCLMESGMLTITVILEKDELSMCLMKQ